MPSQCATPGPWSWAAAWAPSVPGCQHTQPAQNKVTGGYLGPFGGNPTKIGSFSSAAKFHHTLLWWGIETAPIFDDFWPFLLVRPVSEKTATFWPRSHQKRSFDRPVRCYLRYLRARDVQSATLPLVYVTSDGSNLPVRPKKRPRVPKLHTQNGRFPEPGARLLALGDPIATYEWVPHGRFFASTKIPSRTALCTQKQQFCKKTKKNRPAESN